MVHDGNRVIMNFNAGHNTIAHYDGNASDCISSRSTNFNKTVTIRNRNARSFKNLTGEWSK